MVNIEDLTVYYGNSKALENVNLHIEKGQICAVIGPSGAGKSTLLKVMAGIIKDYNGSVYINGINGNPKVHSIGFIPQNYGLLPWKTVEQNIFLSCKIKHGKKNIDMEFYKMLLKELNIEKHAKHYPDSLSGGEKQRAAIARAFLLKPDLLIMDEPFSALDVMTREDVQKLFLDIWKKHNATTILVTHDIKEAAFLGQKIAIMSEVPGKIQKVIDNSMFGKCTCSFSEETNSMIDGIRKMLKRESAYENQ